MSDASQKQIVIKRLEAASKNDLIRLYKDAGWWKSSYDKNSDFLDGIVKDSALFIGAFSGRTQVGMGRALSDMASDAYIQDVAVLKEFRGQGIGQKIILKIIGELKKNSVDWIGLVAQPGTSAFYKKLGFDVLKGHIPLKFKG